VPTPARVRLSQADRRKQLLAAAREEFLARGYEGGRVQAVARACAVTEALVYQHFESKEELFEAAVMEPLHVLLAQRVDDIRAMPIDPEAGAQLATSREFIRVLLLTFFESVESIGVVLFGNREHAVAFWAKHLKPWIDAVVEASEATISRWPHSDFDIRSAVHTVFGMAFWAALDRTLGGSTTTVDEAADHFADIFFNGIKAR
jgi:AcrR family transcriptional regulator